MERQLVKHGNSTLMVSLPKKWIDSHSLNRGDSVHITTLSDKVVITTSERKKRLLETRVYFKESDYSKIRTTLGELYRKGYQKVNVEYSDPKCYSLIELIVRAIQGYEVISQNAQGCIIKSVTSEISINSREIIDKIINITNLEFLIVREYLSKGNKEKVNEIRSIRDDCWKFRNMLYVYLKETLMLSAFDDYFESHLIEHNASFLYWLYKSFDDSKIKKVSKEFLELYDSIYKYFNESIKMIQKKDENYIEFVQKNKRKLLNDCEKYCLKDSKDRFLVIYLSMLIQGIHNPKSVIV